VPTLDRRSPAIGHGHARGTRVGGGVLGAASIHRFAKAAAQIYGGQPAAVDAAAVDVTDDALLSLR